jgi:aldehyde:ferredoxin oxidoreductase
MKGTWNKLLRVDITTGETEVESIPDKMLEYFLGGAGIGAYYLWKECPRGTKAFDPENRMIFAPGPFQGSKQTGSAKWSATTISPTIGMNADSACTASWGLELKACGIDVLIVQGKASSPVYIAVEDDKAVIKEASSMWGQDAYVAEDEMRENEGAKSEALTIGQAGENLATLANIQTRKKSFLGRAGFGAVMGSKNLKGITVKGSNKNCEVYDPAGLKVLNKIIAKKMIDVMSGKPKYLQIKVLGTAMATELFAPQGNLPVKNYSLSELDFPDLVKNLNGENYLKELDVKPWPCKYCVIQCHNKTNVTEGKYVYSGKGPEYESYAMMGFNLLIDDMQAVAYAGELANLYSLDTISLGSILAWAMESYEKGVITKEDTYGIDLTWGNGDAVIEMIPKIANCEEGLGHALAQGTAYAAKKYGKNSIDWAVQMKGQEIAAHNFRAQYISALNYCTGVAAGPNHERGNSQHIWVGHITLPEWGIDHVGNEERWSWDRAAERNAKFHDYCNVINSAVHCKFQEFTGYNLTDLLNTLNAATGLGWDFDDLRKCGERITTLQKILNIRYGWKKEDDFKYPKRFMEPVDKGVAAGKIPVGLDDAILDYYKERRWDSDGIPTKELLKELEMEEFAEELGVLA